MVTSVGHFVSVVLIGLILQISSLTFDPGIDLDDPCINPNGEAGRCINARDCQPIESIRSKPELSPQETDFIKNSQCGGSSSGVLVCCSGISSGPRGGSKVALLQPPNCGEDLSDRISVNQRTRLGQYPFTALILYSKPNKPNNFHCGSSLINSRYVLTAAHCIEALPRGWSVIGVRLGEWDLNTPIDELGYETADKPVDVGIEKIIVHENYQRHIKAQYDDIALIRMDQDVTFSKYIQPICLPVDAQYRNRNNTGTSGDEVGWKRVGTGSHSSVKLQEKLQFKDWQGCSEAYRVSIVLRDTQLCAGLMRGEDTCTGDSGGPLSKLIKAHHFLYGIVNFGPNKCRSGGVPGVYTNVAKYIEWIESKLE